MARLFMSASIPVLALAIAVIPALAGTAPAAAQQSQPVRQATLAQGQPRTPTPQQPVATTVQWDAVRADARAQSAQRQRIQSVAAVRQVQTFPVPRNLEPGDLDDMEVPVLVPTYSALRFSETPNVLLFPRGDFYTLAIMGEGLTIEVFCTRLAHSRAADPSSARYLRGSGPEGYRNERTAYGREISFNRYGAAYSITVECDDSETDPRCTAPDYGEQLMQSLQILPGSRGTGGGR